MTYAKNPREWREMNFQFIPPSLRDAPHSAAVCRTASEMIPPSMAAELRIAQPLPNDEMWLIFICEGRERASISLPGNWLYAELSDSDIRVRIAALLDRPEP